MNEAHSPEKDDRTLECGSEVESCMSVSLAGCTLAKVTNHHQPILGALEGVSRANRCNTEYQRFEQYRIALETKQICTKRKSCKFECQHRPLQQTLRHLCGERAGDGDECFFGTAVVDRHLFSLSLVCLVAVALVAKLL